MYLSKDSIETEIISAKSSEMNVLIPKGDDFVSALKAAVCSLFNFYFSLGWATRPGTVQDNRGRLETEDERHRVSLRTQLTYFSTARQVKDKKTHEIFLR